MRQGVILAIIVTVLASVGFTNEPAQPSERFWDYDGLGASAAICSLCADATWFGFCSEAVEKYFLQLHDEASRTAAGLVVRIPGDRRIAKLGKDQWDRRVTFLEDESDTSHDSWVYLGKIAPFPYHVVRHHMIECYDYRLVDDVTGLTRKIWGYPVISPDDRRFVTASMDIETGCKPNSLTVWGVDSVGVSEEWVMVAGETFEHPNPEVLDWGPVRPWWASETEVGFKAYVFKGEAERPETYDWVVLPDTLMAVLGPDGWAVRAK